MTAKLRIDLTQGVLDIEGDEDFIKEIYADFKERVSEKKIRSTREDVVDDDDDASDSARAKSVSSKAPRSKRAPRRVEGENGKSRVGAYKPQVDGNLNLASLAAFYDEAAPASHPEKILVFAIFLRDKLQKPTCNANDIYSCYFSLRAKTKIPQAFVQALRDTQNKGRFIDFNSVDEVSVTITGENHYQQMLTKKDSE